MACVEVLTSAVLSDICISIRSTNLPSCEASIVGWKKKVILISLRRGASILATKLSKYLLEPRYLRRARAGRRIYSPGGGGKLRKLRRRGKESRWSESDRSWGIPANAFANVSGEKYPEPGISWSSISTRSCEGRSSCGNEGKAIPVEWRVRRR